MLINLIISVFAGKAAETMELDQMKRHAVVGTVCGGLILAIAIPALQLIMQKMEQGVLVEKISGGVGLLGTGILALGFYTLLRGIAFFLALNKSAG